MRINARLDDSYAEKLEFLQAATQLSLSDIVRDSVDRYYEAVLAEQRRQRAGLDKLVGAFSGGPSDGSTRYKVEFLAHIADKYSDVAGSPRR